MTITQQQAREALERVYYATHASFIDRNLVRQYIEQSAAQLQAVVPADQRPVNCGTGYCSCIECVVEPSAQAERASVVPAVMASPERTPQDYAIEHAEYMAVSDEFLIAAINDFGKAVQEVDDGAANPSDVDAARETLSEGISGLLSGIYEFRKRWDRAFSGATTPAAPFAKDSWQHAVDNQLVAFGRTSQEFANPHEALAWLAIMNMELGQSNAGAIIQAVRMLTPREIELLREIRLHAQFGLNEGWQREARNLLLELEQYYRTIPPSGEIGGA